MHYYPKIPQAGDLVYCQRTRGLGGPFPGDLLVLKALRRPAPFSAVVGLPIFGLYCRGVAGSGTLWLREECSWTRLLPAQTDFVPYPPFVSIVAGASESPASVELHTGKLFLYLPLCIPEMCLLLTASILALIVVLVYVCGVLGQLTLLLGSHVLNKQKQTNKNNISFYTLSRAFQ